MSKPTLSELLDKLELISSDWKIRRVDGKYRVHLHPGTSANPYKFLTKAIQSAIETTK